MKKTAVNAKFITDVFSKEESNIVAFGVDCPESLREVSQMVEPFDIDEQRNLLENVRIFDAGDVKLAEIEKNTKEILSAKKLPLILAKEHTVTLHAMKAVPAKTKLIVFDAHADLKDEYEGSKQSHACWLRRWCELAKENCKNVAIVGVRSCDEDEFEFMKNNGVLYFTSNKIKEDFEDVKQRLQNFVGGSNASVPVYVSIDMDVFDPSIAPAVKYAEPEGISYSEFLSLVESLKSSKIVGLDCVEIRPLALGENKITEFLAVKVIFKLLSLIFS
jgi:agmatinase